MIYDATTAKILGIPPYGFFATIGVVFASSLFILLLLKYNYSIQRYSKVFWLSGIGLLTGAKLFGCLTGLYIALANKEPITFGTFWNTGIVYYGGLIGFLLSFLLICKIWDKKIDWGIMDIAVVCVPLFLFWGRLGCFFAGCCFGVETDSIFSIIYTTKVKGEIITDSRIPVQLVEAVISIMIFFGLWKMLSIEKFKGHLMEVYLCTYAIIRIILEFFRGDWLRGVWNGISFSQIVSVCVLISCVIIIFARRRREKYGVV
ncbi:MAG: prolipoprotein diacylglyceryl transferase [Treponema sp.]|nr:prolipoprotein diacylglyceryl transferase [Treponema sp.]